jgi:hypothetical protein
VGGQMRLGGLRAVGPSAVRVPGGVMPQRPPGIPHSQAARGYRAFRLRLNSGAAFIPASKMLSVVLAQRDGP